MVRHASGRGGEFLHFNLQEFKDREDCSLSRRRAISFVVNCDSQEEVDHYWSRLLEGGEESRCGWLKDKYGLSWQIIPSALGKLLSDPDPKRAKRVMEAMLGMKKIDIAGLKKAYDQL